MNGDQPQENQPQTEPQKPEAVSPSAPPAPKPTPPPAPKPAPPPVPAPTGGESTVTTMPKPKGRSYKPLVILLIVLAVVGTGGYFWWRAGFTFDISRFFAAEEPVPKYEWVQIDSNTYPGITANNNNCSAWGGIIQSSHTCSRNHEGMVVRMYGVQQVGDRIGQGWSENLNANKNIITYSRWEDCQRAGTVNAGPGHRVYECKNVGDPEPAPTPPPDYRWVKIGGASAFRPDMRGPYSSINLKAYWPCDTNTTMTITCDASNKDKIAVAEYKATGFIVAADRGTFFQGHAGAVQSDPSLLNLTGFNEASCGGAPTTAFRIGAGYQSWEAWQCQAAEVVVVEAPLDCTPENAVVAPGVGVDFTATGGTAPYTWSVSPDTCAMDKALSPNKNIVCNDVGTYTVTVTDGNNKIDVCNLTIRERVPMTCEPAQQTAQVNQDVSFQREGGPLRTVIENWSAPGGDPESATSRDSERRRRGEPYIFTTKYANPGSYTVTITTGRGQTAQCEVQVLTAEEPPTVDLKCETNGVPSDGPCIVFLDNPVTNLSWTSANATSCTASGGWTGTKATSSSESTGQLSEDTTFTITCSGVGAEFAAAATDTVEVRVLTGEEPLMCSPSEQTAESGDTVSFDALNATGTVTWSAPDGDPDTGSSLSFETNFTHSGLPTSRSFTVTVSEDATEQQDTCTVSVRCQPPSCANPPEGCSYQDSNACECGELICETVSPSPEPVTCSPETVSAEVDEEVTLTADGGSGVYSWSSPNGDPHTSQSGSVYIVSYDRTGGYTVTVDDGQGDFGQCVISVTEEEPTSRPRASRAIPELEVVKTVRNVSRGTSAASSVPASPGETVEFMITVNSTGTARAEDVFVGDLMHVDLVFLSATATINGSPASAVIGQPGAGGIQPYEYTVVFAIGDIDSGDSATLRYQARVSDDAGVAGTTVDLTNVGAAVTEDEDAEATATAIVTIVGLGAASPTALPTGTPVVTGTPIEEIAQVETGPGQATVLALVISAIATLLYVGYTSTSAFRRREAAGYARGKRHPDFRP